MVSVLVSAGPPGFGPLVGLGEGEAPRIDRIFKSLYQGRNFYECAKKKDKLQDFCL